MTVGLQRLLAFIEAEYGGECTVSYEYDFEDLWFNGGFRVLYAPVDDKDSDDKKPVGVSLQ